jgi:ubiquinone/menaquinone biosynthesis C-methylase UbiE
MAQENRAFKHSTPALYDRYMGPLLFEPYARLIAERVALLQPIRILETAAGTGILTCALNEAVPRAQIVAIDLNPVMMDFAVQRVRSERVAFQRADAQDLPFPDGSFDMVLCHFGVMFFPDKVRANREAWRVLGFGGRYLLVSLDRLEFNPVPKAAEDAVVALFPDDPSVHGARPVQLCRSGADRT